MKSRYDLVIIGAGSAGLTAADFAASLGARVGLVERAELGGDCTWTGCIPSKALLRAAKAAHEMRTAGRFGLPAVEPVVDMRAVLDRVRVVQEQIFQDDDSPTVQRAKGIDVIRGHARFMDAHTLAVGDERLRARHVLIASGAHPAIPDIDGLQDVAFLTYESLWELETLPGHLVVIGAGPIGVEMAQAFRRLGSQVTLLASGGQILPRDEPEAARTLAQVLREEGVRVLLDSRAWRVWQDVEGIHVLANAKQVVGDALLVATSRRPNVAGMDLEQAGVRYDDSGIQVDDRLRTSQRHIYAAGDCIGGYQFTHLAGQQGYIAARNALLPGSAIGIPLYVPWTTFTDPEVAHAGMTEAQARAALGDRVIASTLPMAKVDRAQTEGSENGLVKIVHSRKGKVLGATIVGSRAGEMIQEWKLAMDRGIKAGALSDILHVYPTYAMGNMQSSAAIRLKQLMAGRTGDWVRPLTRLLVRLA